MVACGRVLDWKNGPLCPINETEWTEWPAWVWKSQGGEREENSGIPTCAGGQVPREARASPCVANQVHGEAQEPFLHRIRT